MMKINRLLPLERQPGSVLLAMLGWGEARGEGPLGILAVMHVVKNRMLARKQYIEEVILAPQQFSCFNLNDPNRDRMMMADVYDPQSWGECSAIADLVLGEHTTDPTGGATHYLNRAVANPPWALPANGWRETTVIGPHEFGVAV